MWKRKKHFTLPLGGILLARGEKESAQAHCGEDIKARKLLTSFILALKP